MNKLTKILSLAILTLVFASCTKDKDFEDHKYGMDGVNDIKIIDIPSANTTLTSSTTYSVATNTAPVVLTIPVHLSDNDPKNEEINVTLAVDQEDTKIIAYNASITTNPKYIRMPAANYTLSNGGVAKIASGSKDASVTVTFTPSSLTPGVRYAIPVSIVSIDKQGYTISGNQGYRIILVTINR
jgi:hypothetical protein